MKISQYNSLATSDNGTKFEILLKLPNILISSFAYAVRCSRDLLSHDLQMYSMNSHCISDPGAVDTVCVLTDVLYELPLSLGTWCSRYSHTVHTVDAILRDVPHEERVFTRLHTLSHLQTTHKQTTRINSIIVQMYTGP